MKKLPDGDYPFIDERLPLSEMVMVEAPTDLAAIISNTAELNNRHHSERTR